MFVIYAVLVGLLIGAARGGSLEHLGATRIRWAPVALLGLAVQVALFADPVARSIGAAGPAIYVGSTLAVFAVVVRNVGLTGFPLIALGAGANLAAILLNGGYMPADPGALALAGETLGDGYSNSIVLAEPVLRPLTDIFAIPAVLPLANVFSIGDVLISVGILHAIAAAMRPPGPQPA